MTRRLLTCAIVLALTTLANAQTYEISGSKIDGFHAATLEETVAVIRQETGSPGPHYSDIKGFVDKDRSHTSLPKQFVPSIVELVKKIKAPSPIPGYYIIGHGEGVIAVHVHGEGVVLRYKSARIPVNLYVKQVAPAPKPPRPVIDANFLKMFLSLLNDEQREELARQLAEYDVLVVHNDLVE